MLEYEPNPRLTLAIFLGASWFPRAPGLTAGKAFYTSAADFRDYLRAPVGLKIPLENVCWLFDDSRSPSDQLEEIARFLQTRSRDLKEQGFQPQDLFIHYVGHGLFSGADQGYCLAVRATNENGEALSTMRASDLATVVKNQARFLRRFVILDCCFSAALFKEFQTAPLQAVRVQLLHDFPKRGTVLLCSSNAREPSLAPEKLLHTMFSDALLQALQQGHADFGPRLSMSEVGDLVKKALRDKYPNNWVRPEVLSPDQREGDIAGVPVFPNAAYQLSATLPPTEAPSEPDDIMPKGGRENDEQLQLEKRKYLDSSVSMQKLQAVVLDSDAGAVPHVERPFVERLDRPKKHLWVLGILCAILLFLMAFRSQIKRANAHSAYDVGFQSLSQGQVDEAEAAYWIAQTLDSSLIPLESWNQLCWRGSLLGRAAKVITACDHAVAMDLANPSVRDSRGLARAVMGDSTGAIEDFQFFVDKGSVQNTKAARQEWINKMRAGRNPFTPELLAELLALDPLPLHDYVRDKMIVGW
jgi:hypothetical protein